MLITCYLKKNTIYYYYNYFNMTEEAIDEFITYLNSIMIHHSNRKKALLWLNINIKKKKNLF